MERPRHQFRGFLSRCQGGAPRGAKAASHPPEADLPPHSKSGRAGYGLRCPGHRFGFRRSRSCVQPVYEVQRAVLDIGYQDRWAKELGVSELWDRLKGKAEAL